MAEDYATKPFFNTNVKKQLRSTLPSPKWPHISPTTQSKPQLQIRVNINNIPNRLPSAPSQHYQNEIEEQSYPITPSTPLNPSSNYISSGTDLTTPSTTHRNSFPDTDDTKKQHSEFDNNIDTVLSHYTQYSTNPEHSKTHYTQNSNKQTSNDSDNNNDNNSDDNNNEQSGNNNSGGWNGGDGDEKKQDNNDISESSDDDDEIEEEEEENEDELDDNDSNASDSTLNVTAATFVPLSQQSKSAKGPLITINEHAILDAKTNSAPVVSKTTKCKTVATINYYEPHKIYRGKGNVKISTKLTVDIIPNEIREHMSDVYDFMDKYTAINTYNGYDCEFGNLRVFNYGFHNKLGEILYCIGNKVNQLHNRNYGYNMRNKLYTVKEILNELSKWCITENELPQCSKILPQLSKVSELFFANPKSFCENVILTTKWHKIKVFSSVNQNKDFNKRRLTYSISKNEFIDMIEHAIYNYSNNNNCSLIPIVMFNGTKYHVEYVQIIKLRDNTDIGVAYIYKNNNTLKVSGIHLNKMNILNQHQLVSPNHKCHCLEHFESDIDDLHIGNPDDDKNRIKAYKSRNKELSDENKRLNIQLEEAQSKIKQLQRTLTPITISSTSPITSQSTFSTMFTPQYTFGSNDSNTPQSYGVPQYIVMDNCDQQEPALPTFPSTNNSKNIMGKST